MSGFPTSDLLLNLAAEGIGVVVTVFGIDRLIQYREEKRWGPAKNLIYADLLEILDDLLMTVVPYEYFDIATRHYYFGEAVAVGSSGVPEEHQREAFSFSNDEKYVKPVNMRLQVEPNYFGGKQRQLRDAMIKAADTPLEPELRGKLLEVDQALKDVLSSARIELERRKLDKQRQTDPEQRGGVKIRMEDLGPEDLEKVANKVAGRARRASKSAHEAVSRLKGKARIEDPLQHLQT